MPKLISIIEAEFVGQFRIQKVGAFFFQKAQIVLDDQWQSIVILVGAPFGLERAHGIEQFSEKLLVPIIVGIEVGVREDLAGE